MKWISVKLESPPSNCLLLVSATTEICTGNDCKIERMRTARMAYHMGDDDWVTNFKFIEITHWMRLPDPPCE